MTFLPFSEIFEIFYLLIEMSSNILNCAFNALKFLGLKFLLCSLHRKILGGQKWSIYITSLLPPIFFLISDDNLIVMVPCLELTRSRQSLQHIDVSRLVWFYQQSTTHSYHIQGKQHLKQLQIYHNLFSISDFKEAVQLSDKMRLLNSKFYQEFDSVNIFCQN